MKGDHKTRDIPVLAPSIGRNYSPETFAALGDLTRFVDRGNVHDYPGSGMLSDEVVELSLRNARIVSGSHRVIATETGWPTAGRGSGLTPPMPAQAGVLVPRAYLENFRQGIERTFVYELVDEKDDATSVENNWGLLTHRFRPKPAYAALRDMIRLLSDPGSDSASCQW